MERFYRTVVQIEETKKLILQGHVEHLRLALILLDNAVEVIMYRVIERRFRESDDYARMLQTFSTMPLDAKGEELEKELSSRLITLKRQKDIRRYFGEKIKFLSVENDCIPRGSARALEHLHVYRNETQHHDEIRTDSIRAAVLVLYDIATDFLVRLHPGSTMWTSTENYGWLQRYGINGPARTSGEHRSQIARELRSGLPLDVAGIRAALITHLMDRLNELDDQLDFVVENSSLGQDPAYILKQIQFWKLKTPSVDFKTYNAPHGLDSFKRWREAANELNSISDKLEMFDRFATIEDEFEPLEELITEIAYAIDAQVQLQIDIARGK